VKVIDLGSPDVEGVIEAILSCRFVVTGSLHGLIVADAYGIPSAWVMTRTAYGGEYKYFDYFASVDKFRKPRNFDTSRPVTAARLRESLEFDDRPIDFDHRRLLDACPFLERRAAQSSSATSPESSTPTARAEQTLDLGR
jgi:pyruvyltransferase